MIEDASIFSDQSDYSFEISRLINSHFFFLEMVFIRKSKIMNGYYLVIHNANKIVCNMFYPSLRGAKIAFSKFFGRRTKLKINPAWSHFYQPDKDWLEKLFLQEREANHES